jgi:hypothetical protein
VTLIPDIAPKLGGITRLADLTPRSIRHAETRHLQYRTGGSIVVTEANAVIALRHRLGVTAFVSSGIARVSRSRSGHPCSTEKRQHRMMVMRSTAARPYRAWCGSFTGTDSTNSERTERLQWT